MVPQQLESDLSIAEGQGYAPKDFHWLEKSVPCQFGCPAKTDIPAYLSAIALGDYDSAYRINLRANVLPAVLGRICTRPCEPLCRHGNNGLGDPVAICFSKRSAADFAQHEHHILPALFAPSGKKVAVIGAGPSGLAAARDLVLLGHSVAVYERYPVAGGMLTQNIPPFRLPRKIVAREIEQIEHQGVTIHCGVEVGRDITIAQLLEQNDGLIVACGCTQPVLPEIDGMEAEGILHGSLFLRRLIEGNEDVAGLRVAVIGGGFTAVDCARGALLSGAASVTIYYRRQRQDMTLTPGEFEAMSEEGVDIQFLVSPKRIQSNNGKVEGIQFVRNRVCVDGTSGHKSQVEQICGSEFAVQTDILLLATGQAPSWEFLEKANPSIIAGSQFSIDRQRLPRTPIEKLFVAGDLGAGSSSVIEAIASGRRCAEIVDTCLMGEQRLQSAISVFPGRDHFRDMADNNIERQRMNHLDLRQRTFSGEVEQGFTGAVAGLETRRCYLCSYKYEIDTSRCIYCDLCCEVKPQPHCILKVSGLQQDQERRIHDYILTGQNFAPENQFVYRINPEQCIRCNRCLEVCPVHCISVQSVRLTLEVDGITLFQEAGVSGEEA